MKGLLYLSDLCWCLPNSAHIYSGHKDTITIRKKESLLKRENKIIFASWNLMFASRINGIPSLSRRTEPPLPRRGRECWIPLGFLGNFISNKVITDAWDPRKLWIMTGNYTVFYVPGVNIAWDWHARRIRVWNWFSTTAFIMLILLFYCATYMFEFNGYRIIYEVVINWTRNFNKEWKFITHKISSGG